MSRSGINESRYSENSFVTCSFDPSVIYHSMAVSGRDREGYVSMLVIPQKRGNYLLYVNDTNREVLLPRSMIWELSREERVGRVEFTVESVPRYRDEEMKNVRQLYMTQLTRWYDTRPPECTIPLRDVTGPELCLDGRGVG
jgi:hypothetical protein